MRAVDQLIPFSEKSKNMEEALQAIQGSLGALGTKGESGGVRLRAVAYPSKVVLPYLLKTLPGGLLSPSDYDELLSIVRCVYTYNPDPDLNLKPNPNRNPRMRELEDVKDDPKNVLLKGAEEPDGNEVLWSLNSRFQDQDPRP